MNTEMIVKCALATVGVTQILKNIYSSITTKKGKGWVWSLLTIVVGIGITCLQLICPALVMDCIIAISGATVFYDTIFQTFEKIFKSVQSTAGTDTGSKAHVVEVGEER